jgi:hypothetical protein
MKRTLLVLTIFLNAFTVAALSQPFVSSVSKVGTTAASFLEIPVGARALAMGDAYVGIAEDASGLYWNPSGIARIQTNQAFIQHTNWLAGTKFDYAGVVFPLGEFGTVGGSVTSFNSGEMQVTNIDFPDGTGQYFSVNDFAIGVSYARALTNRFSIGFNAKYIQENIWNESASGFAIDVGTLLITDFLNGLRIGASIYNFGTNMQMAGPDLRQFHPIDPTKVGSNQNIPEDIETNSWPLPLNFQFGLATDIVHSESNTLTVAVDALHPSDNYESINLGAEYSFKQFVYFRGGYQSLFLKDHEGGASAGAGLRYKVPFSNLLIAFDYAYNDYGRLNSTNTFSLFIGF